MVTIKDVARAAGVSIATASRAVNDSPLVAGETSARIREIAARLCYSPHGAARSLITSRTHTIGILLPDLFGEFFSELIRGIDQAAQNEGFHCLLASARHTGPLLETALRSMRGRVDGLILMSPEFTGDLSRRTLPTGFPVVLVHCPPTEHSHGVLVANDEGARAMVRHLARLGHQRIAIIRGAEGNYDAAERLRGYREALAECGLPTASNLEFPGDFSEEAGANAVATFLAQPAAERPTAIFAANDCMAIGALSALRAAGLRVPEDLALGGFDDIPMARYMTPPLTSVHVDISAVGARAAARLFDLLQGRAGPAPYREIFPATLVVRQSCGANLHTTPRRVAV
jgi:LacI family transcriptional regulator, galactose operon repressor